MSRMQSEEHLDTLSLETSFIPIQFPTIVRIKPESLNQHLYQTIERHVIKKFSGKCIPKHGFIKDGSVRVVNKQLGTIEGNDFTGNVTFHLDVACLAARPVEGMLIDALVVKKHDAGIIAANYNFPYKLFVPKLPGEEGTRIDRLNVDTYIRVKVSDSSLKAPNTQTKRAEYWVICELAEIDLVGIRRLDLPSIARLDEFFLDVKSLSDIQTDMDELSNDMYTSLQKSKRKIETMNENYAQALTRLRTREVRNDIVMKTVHDMHHRDSYIIGYVQNVNDREVTVKVLAFNRLDNLITGQVETYSLPEGNYQVGGLLLMKDRTGKNIQYVEAINIWSMHIKFVVNQYEMIHPPYSYEKQLKYVNQLSEDHNIVIPSRDGSVVSRSYYKMIEMMRHVIGSGNKNIACIAESPGGFIQALINSRTRIQNASYDYITGVSIPADEGKTAWGKLKKRLEGNEKVIIIEGDDEETGIPEVFSEEMINEDTETTRLHLIGDQSPDEGDILSGETRERLYFMFSEAKADLVTGDAGFPRDKTQSETEEMETSVLILAEILIALGIQAPGGSFLLKIFDMTTYVTVGYLQVLSYCYENVSIFKPRASRNASSEKYVICTGFRVDEEELNDIIGGLTQVIDRTKQLDKDEHITRILTMHNEDLVAAITHYNSIFMKKQSEFIVSGYDYSNSYLTHMSDPEGLIPTLRGYANLQLENRQEFVQEHPVMKK